MDVNTESDVVGKAAYFEFRKHDYTVQMVFMPDGHTAMGVYVPPTVYRRQISSSAPRKSWKISTGVAEAWHGARPPVDDSAALAFGLARYEFVDTMLANLATRGWKLYRQPIIIEVTAADMDDARQGKTPYKVIARITRSRKALGFGEALFAS